MIQKIFKRKIIDILEQETYNVKIIENKSKICYKHKNSL